MKLFLLALLGLVALATAQDPRSFEVLEERSDPDDIDQAEIALMEKEGVPKQAVAGLTGASKEHQISEEVEEPLSPGYEDALKKRSDGMFDENSASNEDVGGSNTSAVSVSRKGRQTLTSLYYCPHRNYLLRWFPHYLGGSLHVCFVPWASYQAITYANCSTRACRIRYNPPRLGRCRPSCYRRRVIIALCFNTTTGQWRWRVIVRNLPQACRCSTC